MKYLDMANDDSTQVNYYPDGSDYKHHADHATISSRYNLLGRSQNL